MSETGLSTPTTEWIPNTGTLGARLALVRWHMGWNVREAERECGLSQNTWGGYEEGSNPRRFVEVINRIVLRTRVNRIWLMTGDGSPEQLPHLDSNQEPIGSPLPPITYVDFNTKRVITHTNTAEPTLTPEGVPA